MSQAKLIDATPAEQAAVLAGLRLLQSEINCQGLMLTRTLTPLILDILTNGDSLKPLAAAPWGERDEFDALCESINSQGDHS